MNYEVTDSPQFHPGACMFTGSSRDLVDLKREITLIEGRAYISREVCEGLADAIGRPTQQALDGAEEQLAVANATIDGLEAQLRNANELLAEAEALRLAIAYTLERGAVLDGKKLTVGLRHVPGQKRIDLTKPLYQEPPVPETVEA